MISTTDASSAFDLYVAPSIQGHYLNYFSTLSEFSPWSGDQFIQSDGPLSTLRRVIAARRRRGQDVQAVHLLFGEKDLLLGILLRLFGFRVDALFYYMQHKSDTTYRTRINQFALSFARWTGLKAFSLEPPSAMPVAAFDAILLDMHDLLGARDDRPNLERANDRKVCLLAGHITDRKMAVEIMENLARLKTDPTSIELRLVGRIDPAYRQELLRSASLLQATGAKVTIVDDRVPSETLRTEMADADLVFAIYREHAGSSGMVVNALALRRPVLFIPNGALAPLAALLPRARQPRSASEIANCIEAALATPDAYRLTQEKHAAFLEDRCPANFARTFHSSSHSTTRSAL